MRMVFVKSCRMMAKTEKLLFFLLMAISAIPNADSNMIRFQPGVVYKYEYQARTVVEKAGVIVTKAEIGIKLLEDTDRGQLCQLLIKSIVYNLHSPIADEGVLGRYNNITEFSEWFSFIISDHGEIKAVFYPENDQAWVIVVKKLLIGSFSAKLHSTEGALSKGAPWSYRVNETGHEGGHEATYMVNQVDRGLLFRKTKYGHVVPRANASLEKEIFYENSLQLPHTIKIREHFTAPRGDDGSRPRKGSQESVYGADQSSEKTHDEESRRPDMHANSESTLKYMGQTISVIDHVKSTQTMREDTLEVSTIPMPTIPLSENEMDIESNMTCMKQYEHSQPEKRAGCFRNIMTMVHRLSDDDMMVFAKRYIVPGSQSVNITSKREIAIDALGACATHTAQDILVDLVLLSPTPNATLVVRALTHFVGLDKPPSRKSIQAIYKLAFTKIQPFPEPTEEDTVHNRAVLVLGSVAKCLQSAEKDDDRRKGDEIVGEIEDLVGVHDPWHHRQKRTTLTVKEFKEYIEKRAALIYSLGNAVYLSSFEHLFSYLNNSESHPMLRRSAVHAISRFELHEAVETLMVSALYDDDETVRHLARVEYFRHPFVVEDSDNAGMFNSNVSTVSTVTKHDRIRRSLLKRLSFEFKLGIPGINWAKSVGSKDIGAEIGLIIRNKFELMIKPSEGFAKIDINNHAYARAHIGLFDWKYTLIEAKLCFYGEAGYKINILQDYGYEEIAEQAKLFDEVVSDVILPLHRSINAFREALSPNSVPITQIFKDFTDAVNDLPDEVANFRNLSRDAVSVIGKYRALPSYFYELQEVILRVSSLFSAVKTDAMDFYHAVNQAVTVILPWAAKQMQQTVESSLEVIKKMFKSPVSSIRDISRFLKQTKDAISALVKDVLEEIEAAFSDGNKPSWFDLDDQIHTILNDLEVAKYVVMMNEQNWKSKDNDFIKQFTGISEDTIREQIFAEVLGLVEILAEPIDRLKSISEPFERAYDAVYRLVKTLKEEYENLRKTYDSAKSLLNEIFGIKGTKSFPRKITKGSCGDGYYPSNIGNTPPGIDLESNVGDKLVAPFTGTIKKSGQTQVTIELSEEMPHTEIVIDHVDLLNDVLESGTVSKGLELGTVTDSGCRPNAIHLAMRRIGTEEYIDPTDYIEKQVVDGSTVFWNTGCDEYLLILKNNVIAGPKPFVGGSEETNENPERPDEPELGDLDRISGFGVVDYKRQGRIMGNSTMKDIPESLTKQNEETDFDPGFELDVEQISKISLEDALQLLDDVQYGQMKEQLEDYISQLQGRLLFHDFKRPETMTLEELNIFSKTRGLESTSSFRSVLEGQYRQPENRCSHLWKYLPKETFCNFDIDCLGIYCHVEMDFFYFPVHFPVSLRVQHCQLIAGLGDAREIIDMIDLASEGPVEYVYVAMAGFNAFEDVQLKYSLSVSISNDTDLAKVMLNARICSKITDYCLSQVSIFEEITLVVGECSAISKPTKQPNDINHLSLRQLEDLFDIVGLNDALVTKLINDMVETIALKKLSSINVKLLDDYIDEFKRFDIKLKGSFQFRQEVAFFSLNFGFPLGPFSVYFGFGAGGTYGVKMSAEVGLLSMAPIVTVTPHISAAVWGSLGMGIPFVAIELRITGYLLTTSFPVQAQLLFFRFPLQLKARVDVNLVPIRLELRGTAAIRIRILWKEFKKVIVNILIWSYTAPTISGNILNKGDLEPDNTPPTFTKVAQDTEWNILEKIETSDDVTDCDVYQLPRRDHIDPAFSLEVAVGDAYSDVKLTFCVGSYKSGCDLLKDVPMGGSAVTIAEMLPGGVVTHFTVTATDSANNAAIATCYLPTYDVSLPEGRVTPEFRATSRRDILRASGVVYDDSGLVSQKEGVGFGYGIFSDQIVPWTDLHVVRNLTFLADQNDPLTQYTRERLGRLILSPYEVASYSRVSDCASHCLNVISTTCLSFNYDFGTSGTCEILLGIEGTAAELHEFGRFHYYERIGVGHSWELQHSDLTLRHGDVYYMQLLVVNDLGYENIISSEPMIADFSPPNPGIIENESIDQVSHEPCLNFLPDEWQFKCIETTKLANFRIIIDGKGSACVFNGHTPYVDLLYTRANTFVSANWDGFHDDETGIYGYTWTIGTEACLDDIHPHKDPHAHLFDESEWTHIGLADSFEGELADGKYHVSVRAINKVDFGGPMATTVCHSIAYTIDRSPPIVHEVTVLGYNEDDCMITVTYNLSDDLSLIREISFGLGKSPRDVFLLDWKMENNITHISYPFCIPDGVPAWVKIRAMNHVELTTVGHAVSPIIVDTSPPIPGEVFDGTVLGYDIDYQSSSDELCVSWRGFYDEESGIEKYIWYAGSSAGSNDTVYDTELRHSDFRECKSGVELKHNESYYSTIVAFNEGHKKLSTAVTTKGVLVDTTPPVEGWIKDGLQREHDMMYSPVATTVSATWDSFSDPESYIKEYLARIWREKHGKGNPSQPENIYTRGSLPAESSAINWHHFHLNHGDHVYTEIEAINKALAGTKVASNGFTIDLTEPLFNFLGDGDTIGVDRRYSGTLSQLAANWDCLDFESGVDHYKVTIYQTYGGLRRQVYPNDGKSHEIVDGDTVIWHSPSTLNLINGGFYSIRVSAVNGAGLGSVRDTSGVTVDSTPPQMLLISIGAMTADEEEELIDGYVMQTDTEGIRAYWEAVDFESGIFAYWIAVGTSSGATDVQNFTMFEPSNGGYIDGLTLKKFSDEENPGTVYYVTCKAENGAGTTSEAMVSSAIKVVSADKVGIVTDGPEVETNDEMEQMAVDIDYQKEIGTVTAQFTGFESEQHGIVHYEWAVGTIPRSDDVQPYISDGIVTDDEGHHVGEGISSSGAAHSLLSLASGRRYFATIRAITGAGNVLDSSSDGFTVDITAPQISIDILEGRNESEITMDSAKYQKSETMESSWTIFEEESEILHTEFCYGSFPGSSDIFNCTDTTGTDQTLSSMVEPNVQGLPNILTLRTTNQVGLTAEAHSDGITVDTTPPTAGNISCPRSMRTTDDLICSWDNFNDKESGIGYYQVAVGFAEGEDAVYPFTVVDSSLHEYKVNGPFLGVQHYFTLIVTNKAGGEIMSFSNPVYVDDTPPIPGNVVHRDGVDEVDYNESGSVFVKCNAVEGGATNDAICQKSVDRLFVAWEGFEDPESLVERYQVAVGKNPGTTDILDFADVDVSLGLCAFIDGVDLYDVRRAFVSVRGYNLAGMHSTAVSNGVYISRVGAGLPPLEGTYIWDGRQDTDVDFQDSNEVLEVQWSFHGDPCPKIHYEWSIFRFDGLQMQNFTTTTNDFGMNDGLDMKNGETYYSVVKATNLLGHKSVIRSDGVTIQLEPPSPKDVRDGDVYGIDLNFQDSITSLSANWDHFGDQCGRSDAYEDETSSSQIIDHYELAMGTDNRYPDTREDISSFVDIGCNVSHTFDNLQLVPRTQTYYATLRAYSVSSSMTEVTSNGIKVGFGGEVVSEGEITLHRYISTADKVSLSWTSFEFGMPVMFYTLGITGIKESLFNISCFELQDFHETGETRTHGENEDIFDIHPWTKVGKDTMVEATGLSLVDKETYHAVVMATDESGFCSLAVADFTVDLTPPVPGYIKVGPFKNEGVTYITRGDMLPVSWAEFYDYESGLEAYSLSLYDGLSCDGKTDPVLLIDFIDVPANDTSYTFVDLDLETNRPYYVHLRVTNKAGLSTTVVSQPVFVDLTDPTAGVVKDSDDFRTDKDYQSSKTSLDGFFLHLPTSEGAACPSRIVSDDFSDNGGWFAVNSQGVWGTKYEDAVMFTPNQVSTDNANGITITMTRDVTRDRMFSGAFYQINTDVSSGGRYSLDIKAASGNLSSITSIVFWDGPDGVAGDFEVPFLAEQWWDEYDDCEICCNQTRESAEEDNCLCNCTIYFEPTKPMPNTTASISTTEVHTTTVPWEIVEDEDPDDTFGGDPELKSIVYQSMGLQIYSGAEKNGEVNHFVALWFRYYNNSEPEKYDIAELDFDPTEAWHSYVLEVTTNQNEMTLELFIDDRSLLYMVGLELFSTDPKFILSVWNAKGKVSPFDDVFNLPETKASFQNIRFPPSADALCRFGDPFRSGENPIVAYFAGVGSEELLDDVVPFYEVYRPCIPCSSQCLDEACDSECSQRDTTGYQVKMTDLALNTTRAIEEDGETEYVPAVYHFTVKAVAGSGRYALASSDGIYIDDTPPVFDYLYHVDLSWSEDEPVTYQGCNSTIAVRWDVYDIGSQVEECKWAIGTWPNATDIQEFVSVGLDNFVWNDELLGLLEDEKTYYVTVWAINSAGLVTVQSTSGVIMVMSPPDVTESNTTSLCGDSNAPPSGLCGDQSSTGLTWTAVDDVAVDAYYYSIGSSEGMEDIFPKTQVGFNESGTVTVKDGAVYVGDEPITNISDVRETEEKRKGADLEDDTVYGDRFHMEPGRTLVSRITVCTKGHLCEDMQSSKMTIKRTQDDLLKAEDGLQIDKNGVKTRRQQINSVKSKDSHDNGETGGNVIVGLLNHDDVTDEYVSDASTNFKPFIVDPETTMDETDRYLRRRIGDIIGPTFYVSAIGGKPLTEPFELSVGYDSSSFDNIISDREPAILYWDSEMRQWKDVSHTCSESFGEYKHDKENSLLTVQVCSTKNPSHDQSYTGRRRKDVNQGFFSGPTEFTMAAIGPFSNSPPVFTSASNLWMWEDGGTLRYQLTAFDDDDDVIKFHLDPSSRHSAEIVKVSDDGEFTYRPCLDCYGVDNITVVARENRDDGFEELSTVSTIQIHIREVNDNPEILFAVNHKSVLNSELNAPTTTTVEQRHANDDFYFRLEALVGAFDPDTSDVLTLTFEPPKHGELKIGSQHTQVTFIVGNCSGPMNITDEHLSVQTPDVPIVVFPCGLVIPHQRDRLAWVFSALEYTPFVDFTGKDSFKINAIDQDGAYSQVAVIDVFVLVNPCVNGGICTGPEHDRDCSSTERSSGFDGYSCICPPGFTGAVCESRVSMCLPNPCPYNFTCVDMGDAHSCHCENVDWPCGGGATSTWYIALITVLCVLTIFIVVTVIGCRRHQQKKKGMMIVTLEPSATTGEVVLGETEMTNMTDRFPSPTQDANQNVSEDRYETDPKSVTLLNVQDANVDFEEEEEEMAGMIVLDTINLVEETKVDENDTTAETTVETETSLTQDPEVTGLVNYGMEAEGELAGDVEECETPADLGSETQASMN